MKSKQENIWQTTIFVFRLLIILIIATGIFLPTENSFLGQFWFFTLQTNFFVFILMITKLVFQILRLTNQRDVPKSKIFNFFQVAVTFYITITGVIFCFVLAPVALITNSVFISSLSVRDIFLHIFVPVMTIIEYYSCEQKLFLKPKNAFLFLIYPILYVLSIFIRAIFGGKDFPGGSPYPYFFIDPSFNNQGWFAVIFYLISFLTAFYLLALLYIYLNNKLTKKQPK